MTARPEAFGIMTAEVDGQNVREVVRNGAKDVERARRGEGPGFILCNTYRYWASRRDISRAYYRAPARNWTGKPTAIR